MSNYLGQTPADTLGENKRFFYGLRRNEDGELFFVRVDTLTDHESIEINSPGQWEDNFNNFQQNEDFIGGINEDHSLVHKNLIWPQYRWDNTSCLYYVDNEGRLVKRVNQSYTYPTGISE